MREASEHGSCDPKIAVKEPDDPEVLISRYAAGEAEAFVLLVKLMEERLFAFICRFLGDYHLAQDVYQNVWIKVASAAGSYNSSSARFASWLFRIARNACIDACRGRKRKRAASLDAGEEGGLAEKLAAESESPGKNVEDAELAVIIADAVEKLPQDQREVFLLKEEADLTFDEIGALLGCERETAKSRMRYAVTKLRNALGDVARQYGMEPDGK